MRAILPITMVIPTLNRPERLARTVRGFSALAAVPAEIIVVDAGDIGVTRRVLDEARVSDDIRLIIVGAKSPGAASQRNQGVEQATHAAILFADDDVDPQTECVAALWSALDENPEAAGAGSVLINQHYAEPGTLVSRFYRMLHGGNVDDLAGKCIGPAVCFLPRLESATRPAHEVGWLNTTCTLYRRECLPHPPFPSIFTGYSYMEDVALSLAVGRRHRLLMVPASRLHHDTQPAAYKADSARILKMGTVNRMYIMRHVLRQRGVRAWLDFFAYQLFMVVACVRQEGWPSARRIVGATISGWLEGFRGRDA